jgi:hypothetical protein
MFVVVTVLCVWLSVVVNRAHRQRDAAHAILALHGSVGYRGDRTEVPFPHGRHICSLDEHSRQPLKDLTDDVVTVTLTSNTAINNTTDDIFDHLQNLPRLEYVWMGGYSLSYSGLLRLRGLRQLRQLTLCQLRITSDEFAQLKKEMPNCRISW